VTISLRRETLEAVERERQTKGESRSEFIVHAVEDFLRRERDRLADEEYIRAYERFPETEEEIAWAEAGLKSLAREPWE